MFRLYSKGCEYAIRALMHAAPHDSGERFLASEVCRKAGIPEAFARKTLQALVRGGFLEAVRGPGGGYVFVEHPKEISILKIIKAVDGETTFGRCILGLPECDKEDPCPLHETWAKAKEELLTQLETKTLQDLIDIASERESTKRPTRKLS